MVRSPPWHPVGVAPWILMATLAPGCASRPVPPLVSTPDPRTVSAARPTIALANPAPAPAPAPSQPLVARRSRGPRPADRVTDVALHAETANAHTSGGQRPGTATRFESNLHPVAFRTEDGKLGWKVDLGAGRPLATPAVVDGVVYAGGGFGSHEFYALDASTGASRWALRVSDDGPTAAAVSDGVVAFNTESCTLFVVDAASGRMLWSRWLGDPLMSQPTIADGKVFMAFPTPSGHRLVAFSLRTGEELWRVPLTGDIISAPVAAGDSVFSSTFDGTVYRHRMSDGGLAWSEGYRATSAPWLFDDQVFVSHREDPVVAPLAGRRLLTPALFLQVVLAQVEGVGRISGSTGHQDQPSGSFHPRAAPWLNTTVQRNSGYHHSQAASDTSVGFASAPASAQVDRAEANVGQGTVQGLWEYQGSRPCVVDGRVFLTQGDQLTALDPDTGRELWTRPLAGVLATAGGHLASPPSAAGGKLYLASVTGDIVVVAQDDGHVLDTIRVGSPMRFQPAIANGWLYVGTATGQLVGLDLRDTAADGWSMWGGGPAHNGP